MYVIIININSLNVNAFGVIYSGYYRLMTYVYYCFKNSFLNDVDGGDVYLYECICVYVCLDVFMCVCFVLCLFFWV